MVFLHIDVVAVLTKRTDLLEARKNWNKLKLSFLEKGYQTVTTYHQLKMKRTYGKS